MRAGKPFQCGSGSPFISHAISVFSSSAFQTGMLFTKSGVFSIDATVGAVERDFEGTRLHARLREHVLQAHALPLRVAHGAVAPLHARHMRDRTDRGGCRSTGTRPRSRPASNSRLSCSSVNSIVFSAASPPTVSRHCAASTCGNVRQVIAHEERIVRRERLAEVARRRLEVRRPPAALDERQLARQRVQGRGFERARRQAGRPERRRAGREPGRRRSAGSGDRGGQKSSSIEWHGSPPHGVNVRTIPRTCPSGHSPRPPRR